MMTKDEHIKLLRKQLFSCSVLLGMVSVASLFLSIQNSRLIKRVATQESYINRADSINTVNTIYMAGLQAQFDSITKHIRPYEDK